MVLLDPQLELYPGHLVDVTLLQVPVKLVQLLLGVLTQGVGDYDVAALHLDLHRLCSFAMRSRNGPSTRAAGGARKRESVRHQARRPQFQRTLMECLTGSVNVVNQHDFLYLTRFVATALIEGEGAADVGRPGTPVEAALTLCADRDDAAGTRTGSPAAAASSRARSSPWSKPRSRRRSRWTGTLVTASAPAASPPAPT